ncbi:MAG TPA: hypothetical protein VF950_26405 [Planctomycetota bacterium]
MNTPAEPRRAVVTLVELALAGLLIAWRCVAPTWHPFWRDILFLLGLYWIFLVLCRNTRAREGVTLALTLVCLGIYLKSVMQDLLFVANLLPPE